MAVDRVDAPDDGDRDAAAALVDRRRVKIVRGLQPVGGRREVVAVRPAVAADEDGAEMIAADVGRGPATDRKRCVWGKRWTVRLTNGGRRIIQTNNKKTN